MGHGRFQTSKEKRKFYGRQLKTDKEELAQAPKAAKEEKIEAEKPKGKKSEKAATKSK